MPAYDDVRYNWIHWSILKRISVKCFSSTWKKYLKSQVQIFFDINKLLAQLAASMFCFHREVFKRLLVLLSIILLGCIFILRFTEQDELQTDHHIGVLEYATKFVTSNSENKKSHHSNETLMTVDRFKRSPRFRTKCPIPHGNMLRTYLFELFLDVRLDCTLSLYTQQVQTYIFIYSLYIYVYWY